MWSALAIAWYLDRRQTRPLPTRRAAPASMSWPLPGARHGRNHYRSIDGPAADPTRVERTFGGNGGKRRLGELHASPAAQNRWGILARLSGVRRSRRARRLR